MLELNRSRFANDRVQFVEGDVFRWEPGERFDAAFVGFFISHIPPDRFGPFLARLVSWLEPGADVFLCDDATGSSTNADPERIPGAAPFAHPRRLGDGREYAIVKVFYTVDTLAEAFDAAGWDADLRSSGRLFLYGTARPRAGEAASRGGADLRARGRP